jgi:hypothetical protein
MKWITILLASIVFVPSLYPLKLPVDIYSLDAKQLMNEGEPALSNGYFQWKKTFDYYGTRIEYEIDLNKSNSKDIFIFFKKPSLQLENFTEFYKDVVLEFAKAADLIVYNISYSLAESVVSYDCYRIGMRCLKIYMKSTAAIGLFGFGIALTDNPNVTRNDIDGAISNYSNHDILPISMIELGTSEFGKVYIADSMFINGINETVTFQKKGEEEIFFKKWLVKRDSMNMRIKVEYRKDRDWSNSLLSVNTAYFYNVGDINSKAIEVQSWNKVFCINIDGAYGKSGQAVFTISTQ